MAVDKITEPTLSIHDKLSCFPTKEALERLRYRDQLTDSLAKAEAMLFIFGCARLEDFDEKMIQNFTLAVLDMVYRATDALNALEEMKDNPISPT